MRQIISLLSICVLITSCSIKITEEGTRVRLLADQEKINCTSLGVVTGSMSTGATTGDDAESAMNEVRNKAAKFGANSLHIIGVSSTGFTTTVIGEAFNCNL